MRGIIHHAGAFQVYNRRELRGLLGSHMNLVLDPPYLVRQLEASDHGSQERYIDDLVPLIFDNVHGLEPIVSPASCMHKVHGCTISSADFAKVHAAVSSELRRVRHDPRIVGFYIQDDPMGNTRKLNQDIHAWIAKAGLHLPTVCGFKGRLDVPGSPQWMSKLPNFAADIVQGYFASLNNYSPQGCDMVALYPFGPQAYTKHDAATLAAKTDWKMSNAVWPCGTKKCTLLNFYRYALAKLGWTPATPLIGVPQAFGFDLSDPTGKGFVWPEPTSRQLTDETAAFCAGGAQSVLAYGWHVYDAGSSSPYMDKSLRTGLTAGVKACSTIWSHQSATPAKAKNQP
jgi:hypothetical protein